MAAPRSEAPVAILAGSGELPLRLSDRLREAGRPHRILAFRGFADRTLRARADAVVGLLDVGAALACLDKWRPGSVTLAGGLRRPSAGAALDAFAAFRNRDDLAAILARGDDGLLRGVAALIEERGLALVGLRDLAPELLAPPGSYGRLRPDGAAAAEIALGLRVLAALSPFDLGQAVAVAGERVLAVEGPEGTDRMLRRAAALGGRAWPWQRRWTGILLKAPKHGQDLRIDLPAIGPRTVAFAARAGLAGIAVAEGLAVVLDPAGTARAADRLGLFVTGVATEATGA